MKHARTSLILAITLMGLLVPSSASTKPLVTTIDAVVSTNPLHAVRLRKLHLVRPDLIAYPVSFDVVC